MTIAPGQRLPDATFKIMTADGAVNMTTDDIFSGKKVVLFVELLDADLYGFRVH